MDNTIVPPGYSMLTSPGQYPYGESYHKGEKSEIFLNNFKDIDSDVLSFIIPGFRALDNGMKHYWSGIKVPTIDSYRFMSVKVAGGDKSILVWSDDLKNGRVSVPVCSINRTDEAFNEQRFSLAIHPMAIKYPNYDGTYAVMVYRPVPFIVRYNLHVWASFKTDLEYIKAQVLTRFNRVGIFKINDGKLTGDVTLHFDGSNNTTDVDAPFDKTAYKRFDVSLKAEAWLPLPERIVKTILSNVVAINDVRSGVNLSKSGGY